MKEWAQTKGPQNDRTSCQGGRVQAAKLGGPGLVFRGKSSLNPHLFL